MTFFSRFFCCAWIVAYLRLINAGDFFGPKCRIWSSARWRQMQWVFRKVLLYFLSGFCPPALVTAFSSLLNWEYRGPLCSERWQRDQLSALQRCSTMQCNARTHWAEPPTKRHFRHDFETDLNFAEGHTRRCLRTFLVAFNPTCTVPVWGSGA